jgi:FkbM family methyltransferase
MLVKGDDHQEDIRSLLQHLPKDLPRTGVIHVGAHLGEEVPVYFEHGFQQILLIEANPDCCLELGKRFGQDHRIRIVHRAISDRAGKIILHVHTSRSGSTEPASLLQMKQLNRIVKTLSTPRVIEVDSSTLDDLLAEMEIEPRAFTLLNVDIQGAELHALRGSTKTLRAVSAVVTEVNLIELYEGGALENDIVEFLEARTFAKNSGVYHTLYDDVSTFPAWGECLFLRVAGESSA